METGSHFCERRTLARNGLVTIESCECGVVHMTLKAMTLRFDPGALLSLRDALDEAAASLAVPEPTRLFALKHRGTGSA